MGAIGMSLDDFCRSTPAEFRSVADAWHRAEERRERSGWEQTRMQCLYMLQPYSRRMIEPRDVMRFPWDAEETQTEKLTTKEIRERFERVKREQGIQ